jgi:hypothetical protein
MEVAVEIGKELASNVTSTDTSGLPSNSGIAGSSRTNRVGVVGSAGTDDTRLSATGIVGLSCTDCAGSAPVGTTGSCCTNSSSSGLDLTVGVVGSAGTDCTGLSATGIVGLSCTDCAGSAPVGTTGSCRTNSSSSGLDLMVGVVGFAGTDCTGLAVTGIGLPSSMDNAELSDRTGVAGSLYTNGVRSGPVQLSPRLLFSTDIQLQMCTLYFMIANEQLVSTRYHPLQY